MTMKWQEKFNLMFVQTKSIFTKDFIVGLDIGSSSVKLAQFIKKDDGLHLIKAGLEEIIPTEGKESGEKETLFALQKLLTGVNIKKSKFIVSINCSKTAIKNVILPYMPKADLKEAIELAAKNYFPFPLSGAVLDFEILGDVWEKGVRKYEVLVATSPKKTIEKYLSLLAKAKIKPASFIPVSYACSKLMGAFPREKVNCLLDIGACFSELIIFSSQSGKGKDLIFQRKIPVAGGDFTKAMTTGLVSDKGRLQLSPAEAERIKREIGIPAGPAGEMIEEKISTTQISAILRSPLDQLVSEIDRCFDYYREQSTEAINSLILSGGGAHLRGLADFLHQELGVEVSCLEPLEGIKVESRVGDYIKGNNFSLQLAPALGGALSKGKGINLLPPEIKQETKHKVKRTTFAATTAVVILTLVFLYIGMRISLNNFQKRISTAKHGFLSLRHYVKDAQVFSLANKILADEPYWEDVFKSLSNIIPDDIYLTELSMKDKAIKLRGIIVSNASGESLSKFIFILEKDVFKGVKLVTTRQIKEKETNEFELSCWID